MGRFNNFFATTSTTSASVKEALFAKAQGQDTVRLSAGIIPLTWAGGSFAPARETDTVKAIAVLLPGIATGSSKEGVYTMPLDRYRTDMTNPPRNWAVGSVLLLVDECFGVVAYRQFVGKDASGGTYAVRPLRDIAGDGYRSAVQAAMAAAVSEGWGFNNPQGVFHELSWEGVEGVLAQASGLLDQQARLSLRVEEAGLARGGDTGWRSVVGAEGVRVSVKEATRKGDHQAKEARAHLGEGLAAVMAAQKKQTPATSAF